jgi:hypothetical protein
MKRRYACRAVGVAVAAALVGLGLDAGAQVRDEFVPWTTILVHGPGCSAGTFMEGAFVHLLELELLTDRMQVTLAQAAPTAGLLTVEVPSSVCDANAREALVTVRATGGGRNERSIALGDLTMDARPRALALAVAEQIRATRVSFEIAPPLPVRAPSPYRMTITPDSPDCAVPASRGRDFELAGFAAWRTFEPAKTSLLGGELAATFALPQTTLALRVDAAGFWTSANDVLGRVSISSYSAGLAGLFVTGRSLAFLVGPHVELGYAQASGEGTGGSSGGQALVTASLLAGARASFFSNWAAVVEIEGGLTARGLDVHANERLLASMHGGWFTARAGIALRP